MSKGIPVRRWNVQPLRGLRADLPIPYTVEAALGNPTVRVELNIGAMILLGHDGTIRNSYGTPLCRLVKAEKKPGPWRRRRKGADDA